MTQEEAAARKLEAEEVFLVQTQAVGELVERIVLLLASSRGANGMGGGYSLGAVCAGLIDGAAKTFGQGWQSPEGLTVEVQEGAMLAGYRELCRVAENTLLEEFRKKVQPDKDGG